MKVTTVSYDDLLKKGKKAVEKPFPYLPSMSHPDYHVEELRYIGANVAFKAKAKGKKPVPGRSERIKQAEGHLAAIAKCWSESGLAPFRKEGDQHVKAAIEMFDHTAFCDDLPFRISEIGKRLGGEVCRVIGYLRNLAIIGTREQRRIAKKRLKEILIPDSRGKKDKKIDSSSVRFVYYKNLFWVYQIGAALRSPTGERNMSRRVKTVSKNFRISIEVVRELWCLDETDNPKGRPIPVRERARILTQRHFSPFPITQSTISNILAS